MYIEELANIIGYTAAVLRKSSPEHHSLVSLLQLLVWHSLSVVLGSFDKTQCSSAEEDSRLAVENILMS